MVHILNQGLDFGVGWFGESEITVVGDVVWYSGYTHCQSAVPLSPSRVKENAIHDYYDGNI